MFSRIRKSRRLSSCWRGNAGAAAVAVLTFALGAPAVAGTPSPDTREVAGSNPGRADGSPEGAGSGRAFGVLERRLRRRLDRVILSLLEPLKV